MSRYHLELLNGWTSEWEPESKHREFDSALWASERCVNTKWRILDSVTGEILDEHDPFYEEACLEFNQIETARRWNEIRIQREQNQAIRQRLIRIASRQRRNLKPLRFEEKVDWAREGF